ncbi:MAG TPA: FAD-binding oxidoreductase [Candidatus Brocadiia bacterium]|nr:FAD-linked oxidase C-terminal domain-containing protein [Candidatus Brocadiales bacterium]
MKTLKEMLKPRSSLKPDLLRLLQGKVGKDAVFAEIEDRICYAYDGTKDKVIPDVVVKPVLTNQIAETLKIANEYLIPVYPRGAGTGLSGGAVPIYGGIVLDLMKMNKIIEILPGDLIATVEPGVITRDFQNEAAKYKLFYPPDPSSAEFSTIGGNVAECAGGMTSLKYGVTRDYVLALEVVLPDGNIIQTGRKTLRSVTGYDLTRLLVGSEGTLGIFTKITVRLIPLPEKVETLLAYFHTTEDASEAAGDIINHHILPRALEFMDEASINSVRKYKDVGMPPDVKALLLIDVDGNKDGIQRQLSIVEESCKRNNAFQTIISRTSDERNNLWAVRRSLSPALYSIAPVKLNEDFCVPRSKVTDLLQRIDKIKPDYPIDVVSFGHIGDGNIHVNLMYQQGQEQQELAHRMVLEIIHEVLDLGGTISGEHGIGSRKAEFMKLEVPPLELELMKGLKRLFDPKGIMNPGKIFI